MHEVVKGRHRENVGVDAILEMRKFEDEVEIGGYRCSVSDPTVSPSQRL